MAALRLCSIPDCGKRHFGRGFCSAHYERWRRHGDPLGGRTFDGKPMEFFRDVVLTYDGDECLTWPFGTANGYGKLHISGEKRVVSRLVCEHVNGPPPSPDYDAAHLCGNGDKGCVAQRHMVWKTRAGNMADAIAHGTTRQRRNYPAKLSKEDVLRIRELKGQMRTSDIARAVGHNRRTVTDVLSGKAWSWV
jgi:hypothetical protein